MGDYYCLGGPPGAEIGVLREAVHLPSSRLFGTRSSTVEFFIQRSRKKSHLLLKCRPIWQESVIKSGSGQVVHVM